MSLTKATLLEKLDTTKPERIPGKVLGMVIYVKPITEFQRSRRLSMLIDDKGNFDRSKAKTARLYSIIDHICDENGEPLFKESDLDSLMKLDALKLDILIKSIEEWVERREGKLSTASVSSKKS